jgi:hypothetical protein
MSEQTSPFQGHAPSAPFIPTPDANVYLERLIKVEYQGSLFNDSLNAVKDEVKDLNKTVEGLIIEVKFLDAKIDGVEKSLTAKIDGVEKSLTAKIDGVEKSLTAKFDAKFDGLEKTLTSMRNAFWAVARTYAVGILILLISQIFSHT